MAIFLLYWIFSSLYVMGMNYYTANEKFNIIDLIGSILFGWLVMPISLGTARSYGLDKARRELQENN
jgi:hypothetical protein